MRPDWRTYFLGKTEATAERADCTRRKVGAVIVKNNREIGNGYNGFPPGVRGCLEGGCPRGKHYPIDNPVQSWNPVCACGHPGWPCPESVEPGSSYDTGPGSCWSTHAELNAIMQTGWAERQGATMYITDEPCTGCLKIIACSGILRVIWPGGKLDFPFLSCYTSS